MQIFKEIIFCHIINILKFVIKSIKLNLINVTFSYLLNGYKKFLHRILKRLASTWNKLIQAETRTWHSLWELSSLPCYMWHPNVAERNSVSHDATTCVPRHDWPSGAGIIFLILAHPVYKTWIMQEPNTLELWNKLHFEEKKKRRVYTMFKRFSTYICWINI